MNRGQFSNSFSNGTELRRLSSDQSIEIEKIGNSFSYEFSNG